MTLDRLANGQEGVVAGLQARGGMNADLLRRLTEIGFIPGERVCVLARGLLGGPPLAVRVGTSTFALRPMEAQSVDVIPQSMHRS